ncbi:uncharacterized protein PHACADRAFT_200389 [Phanerochaete carnosa HHB-10118-sp]|uniref:non-specific serine/threonine protein kinase n=1 Tax=Phanerochaete carnosa (strain HHB-10118-sp) TaxID=650164 RepID=K5ULB9_PHACS|nr:uncharacterized protein PHACADRAFT_200389 [Phanerochaete carnosa HHB-10118-sp]EKM50446.1 hypothetical protein PHACADRAFT_200389 [Phanerochaete carnosa HHB-10118-sp]
MGLFAKFKTFGRENKDKSEDVKIMIQVRHVSESVEEKENSLSFVIHTTCMAEQILPALLNDAAHSPEVLSLRTSRRLSGRAYGATSCSTLSTSLTVVASVSHCNLKISTVATCEDLDLPAASPALVLKSSSRSLRLKVSDFKQVRPLGFGAYGDVYLVEHEPTQTRVAMKVMNKRTVDEAAVVREKNILQQVGTRGSNGINEFLGSFHNHDNYYLLMKYYPGGDLRQQIRRRGRFPLDLVRMYGAELLVAIKTLHDLGIVHRDIKPDNILISETGHLILTDFGMAKSVITSGCQFFPGSEMHEFLRTWCGTLQYMSPEVYQGMPYAFSADVWSFAIVVFEMLVGRTPWTGHWDDDRALTEQKLLHTTLDGWLDGKKIDDCTRSFLEMMLETEPSWRLTLMEATGHPFFDDFDWSSILNGTNDIPNVGVPLVRAASHGSETFLGSFSGGGVYPVEEDPHPEFHYAASVFEVKNEDEPMSMVEEQSIVSHDTFDDIPLGSSESIARDVIPSPPQVLNMAPPPAFFGMMAGITTTVTIVAEEESEPLNDKFIDQRDISIPPGVAMAVAIRHPSIFKRLVSWFSSVTSSITRICSRLSFR